MTTSFAHACAAAAGLDLAGVGVAVDPRGLQNLVIHASGRVYRFPRRPGGAEALAEAAERLRIARAAGVPAPEVLDVREGPVGTAHLVLGAVPGLGLDEFDAALLATASRERLAHDLVAVAGLIHTIDQDRWPGRRQPWGLLWQDLVDRATAAGSPQQQVALARRAAAAAGQAPIGVFHGDLGGVNCRVDPGSGAVTGVLDWDSATVGDIGTDSVAILAGVPDPLAARIRRIAPEWAEDERRYRHYIATWPLQHHLWAGASDHPGDPLS